jgi:DNA-directed RNA polymerase beta subunit
MERDALIAHGASAFLKEKLFTLSDKYEVPVCNKCGMIGHPNKTNCRACKDSVLLKVDLPYACKLLFQELLAMNIAPRIKMNEKGQPEVVA